MGKASRRRRSEGPGGIPAAAVALPVRAPEEAQAAMRRLLGANEPGRLSLAGAYAFGFGALGMAQQEDDGPDWYNDLDPLDTLFLGTAFPRQFTNSYQFANGRTAWLRLLAPTVHHRAVERFVALVADLSADLDMAVDDGEFMLLVAAHLEDAGLDQRKLPASLLPGTGLADSRVARNGGAKVDFATPPDDAPALAARMWASLDIHLPHDGTPADALREGLSMFSRAGLPVRDEPAMLLPALYAALVASDSESLTDAGERAVAWAIGLAEDSPLVAVVDALLAGPEQGMDVDTLLGHLFALPAFTAPVSAEDRRWHSSPATDLIDWAFALGRTHIKTLDGTAVRMGGHMAAELREQNRRFEEKFGRPPGPDDPVFFDPNSDIPTPMPVAAIAEQSTAMLTAAGVGEAWMHAHHATGGLIPNTVGRIADPSRQQEWDDAIAGYVAGHPGAAPDNDAEVRKLQLVSLALSIDTAADSPGFTAALLAQVAAPPQEQDPDTVVLRSFLTANAASFTRELRADPVLAERAAEIARAAAGATLADHVRRTAATTGLTTGSVLDLQVSFTVAVAHRAIGRDAAL